MMRTGFLKVIGVRMIEPRNMEHPDAKEEWNDSQSRDRRWSKWLDEGVKGDENFYF
jgi:hypothetical protein